VVVVIGKEYCGEGRLNITVVFSPGVVGGGGGGGFRLAHHFSRYYGRTEMPTNGCLNSPV